MNAKRAFAAAMLVLSAFTLDARAATFEVFAEAHSWNSGAGSGLATGISLSLGENFSVSAALDDLWSAGPLPRWSNADGLVATLLATGSDDSGQPAGTQIGANFGLFGPFPFGMLVGRIGTGDFFGIGTSFNGTANASGTLDLFYWDGFSADNAGSVLATVSAIPEPESYALLAAGLALFGFAARRTNPSRPRPAKSSA